MVKYITKHRVMSVNTDPGLQILLFYFKLARCGLEPFFFEILLCYGSQYKICFRQMVRWEFSSLKVQLLVKTFWFYYQKYFMNFVSLKYLCFRGLEPLFFEIMLCYGTQYKICFRQIVRQEFSSLKVELLVKTF